MPTQTIFPATTTDSSDFPPNAGGTAHGNLSDDSDNTYIAKQAYQGEAHSANGGSLTGIQTTGVASVTSVQPTSRALGETTVDTSAARLRAGFVSGGTFYDAFNAAIIATDPFSFSGYTGTSYTTNPNGGAAWTPTSVNALGWQAGAGDWVRDGNVVRISELHFTVVFVLSAPTATTNVASNITQVAAKLNGTVNPTGAVSTYPVSYFFQWGLTTGYGNTTSTVGGLTGSSDVTASANISGLTANTTYHFRLVATNADNTVNGNDQIFTTLMVDPVILVL